MYFCFADEVSTICNLALLIAFGSTSILTVCLPLPTEFCCCHLQKHSWSCYVFAFSIRKMPKNPKVSAPDRTWEPLSESRSGEDENSAAVIFVRVFIQGRTLCRKSEDPRLRVNKTSIHCPCGFARKPDSEKSSGDSRIRGHARVLSQNSGFWNLLKSHDPVLLEQNKLILMGRKITKQN